jgi:ribulose-bisphosphate carboxylase large chain
MRVLSKIARIIGVDQLHVGTVVGKMFETKEEVAQNCEALENKKIGVKPVLPVASGGLYPGLVPELIEFFGKDFIIQAGGGIHGHKDGTVAGARAMRQAVEASLKGVKLEDFANTHVELRGALETWKTRD